MDKHITEIAKRNNYIYILNDLNAIQSLGLRDWNEWNKNKYPFILDECKKVAKEIFCDDSDILTAVIFYCVFVNININNTFRIEQAFDSIQMYSDVIKKNDINNFCKKYFKNVIKELENADKYEKFQDSKIHYCLTYILAD